MFKLPESLILFNVIKERVEKVKNSKLEKVECVFNFENKENDIYFLGKKDDEGVYTDREGVYTDCCSFLSNSQMDSNTLLELAIQNSINYEGKYDCLLRSKKDDCVYDLNMRELCNIVKIIINKRYVILEIDYDEWKGKLDYSIKPVLGYLDFDVTTLQKYGITLFIHTMISLQKITIIEFKKDYKLRKEYDIVKTIDTINEYIGTFVLCKDDFYIDND